MKTLGKNLLRQNDKLLTNNSAKQYNFQDSLPFYIAPVSGRKVEMDFQGGSVTSDAGVLLLNETERQIGIIESIASCIRDERRHYSVDHSVRDILAQRVYQIACGYEDAVDCNTLRVDPVMKLALGRLPIEGDDLASQPTMSRIENGVSRTTLLRIGYAFVDSFIHSYTEEPELIVVDFDETDNSVYGGQQERLFNDYFGEYCFMPLHVYEGLSGKLITTILRPGKRLSGKETLSYLKRLIERIRKDWERTIIVFRGDSHLSSPEVFDWIDEQKNVYSVTGLTSNGVLKRQIESVVTRAKKVYEQTKRPVKLYHSFPYKAGSWKRARKVVAKVEVSEKGANIRFISTDILQAKAKALYEDVYCHRGNNELYIKDHKTYLKSDRSSCHRFEANQFRLFLHSMAYVLLHTYKTQLLKGTEFANATMETLRLKLLKVGARVIELKTKIKVHLPTAYPYKKVFRKSMAVLSHLRNIEKASVPLLC